MNIVPNCDPCRVRAAILMPTTANRTLGLDALDRLEGALTHAHGPGGCQSFRAEQGGPVCWCGLDTGHRGRHVSGDGGPQWP